MGNDQAKEQSPVKSMRSEESQEEIEQINRQLMKERGTILSKNGIDILPLFKVKESQVPQNSSTLRVLPFKLLRASKRDCCVVCFTTSRPKHG